MTDDRDRVPQSSEPGADREETLHTGAGMVATAFGLTDVGCQRSVNQDTLGNRAGQHAARAAELGLLYAVADGMGGHARGEVASALAIEHLFARFYGGDPAEDPRRLLAKTLLETNGAVYQAGREHGGASMGTTLTLALLREDSLYVGNIGDSRTYCIRAGQIEQLTHDHSLIGEQVRSGLLTEAQARQSSIRNVITRAVGYRGDVEPDVFTFPVAVGDIVLLCSDGLHSMVEGQELAQALSTQSLAAAVPALIELAKQRGGPDNITALAVRVDQLAGATGKVRDEATTVPITPPLDDAITKPTVRIEGTEAAAPAEPPAAPPAQAPAAIPPPPPSMPPPPAPIVRVPPSAAAHKPPSRFPIALLVVLPLVLLTAFGAGFVALAGRDQGQGATTATASTPATVAGGVALATPLATPTTLSPSAASAAAPSAAPTGAATTRTPQTSGAPLQPTPAPVGTATPAGTQTGGSEPRPTLTTQVLLTGTMQFRPPLNPGLAQRVPEEWEVVVYATSAFPQGSPERPTDEQLAGMPVTWRGAIKSASISGAFPYEVQGEWSLSGEQGTFLVALRHKTTPGRFLLPEQAQLRVTVNARQTPLTHNLTIAEPIE